MWRCTLLFRGGAFIFSVAAPDGLSVPVGGVPDFASEEAPAFSTYNAAGEQALTTVPVPVHLPFLKLKLRQVKHLFRDDGGVAVPDIVLGQFTLVFLVLLGQKIRAEGFLENCIALVALVLQDGQNRARAPDFFFPGRGDL